MSNPSFGARPRLVPQLLNFRVELPSHGSKPSFSWICCIVRDTDEIMEDRQVIGSQGVAS